MKKEMGAQAKALVRLMRGERKFWHRGRGPSGNARLRQFLRIARGHLS